jgi:hypothetical protein
MELERRTSLLAGVLMIITFITSIPALLLYNPLLKHANYILGAGADKRVFVGALLEVLLILANVGTAVVLFPILKRFNEKLALGYVTARLVECGFIAIGILSILSVVTLRQDIGGTGAANAASLTIAGRSLVAIHDWSFLLGPGFIVGVGNGLMLGYMMFRTGLVPRRLAMFGLVGGPLVCASGIAVLFGLFDKGSAAQFIATIPEFIWELGFGIWLAVKGFKPSPILAIETPDAQVKTGPLLSPA